MHYKFILKKDLPKMDVKAGYTIKCIGLVNSLADGLCYMLEEDSCITYAPVGKCLLDNRELFDKQIDEESLVDCKCPICGETRGVLKIQLWNGLNRDNDDYGINAVPIFEYACGHPDKYIPWEKGKPDSIIKATK